MLPLQDHYCSLLNHIFSPKKRCGKYKRQCQESFSNKYSKSDLTFLLKKWEFKFNKGLCLYIMYLKSTLRSTDYTCCNFSSYFPTETKNNDCLWLLKTTLSFHYVRILLGPFCTLVLVCSDVIPNKWKSEILWKKLVKFELWWKFFTTMSLTILTKMIFTYDKDVQTKISGTHLIPWIGL